VEAEVNKYRRIFLEMGKSLFIAVEGIDRSGKTSLCRLLKESLMKKGAAVEQMGYPNRKNKTGELIGRVLSREIELEKEAVHLLFSANRWEERERLKKALEPEESRDKIVICDRYSLSGIAYSISNGVSEEYAKSTEKGITQPDLTVFLDVDPETASKRSGFGGEVYETKEFQNRVYREMKKQIDTYKNVVVESSTLEEMHEKALQSIESLLQEQKENRR